MLHLFNFVFDQQVKRGKSYCFGKTVVYTNVIKINLSFMK